MRRATVVGERTAGAANSSRPVPVAHGFTLVVHFARVVSPVTGTNWEGVGVQPDVAVAPEVALDVAHLYWTVTASGSDLLLKRAASGASFGATAITADGFAVLDEPDVQFEFLRTDNRVTALRVLGPSGEWIPVPR